MKIISKITLVITIIFLAKLIYFNELELLIHPRYFWLTNLSLIILLITTFLEKKSTKTLNLAEIAILTIFSFGILTDLKPLSSSMQSTNTLNNILEINQPNNKIDYASFELRIEELDLEELVSLFSHNPEPSKYSNKAVNLTGFYFETADGLPMIAKYTVNCCAADARIIGVLLEKPLDIKPDTWIKIQGTLTDFQKEQQRLIAIKDIQFELIPTPETPYATK